MDGLWETAGNWTGGVPDSTKDVVIAGSSTISLAGGTRNCKSISAPTFTGSLTGSVVLNIFGDVTLGPGVTVSSGMTISIVADGTIDLGGAVPNGFVVGQNSPSSYFATATMISDINAYRVQIVGGSTLALGTHDIVTSMLQMSDGSAALTWSTGATIRIDNDLAFSAASQVNGTTLPPLTIDGTGAGAITFSGNLVASSLVTEGGTISFANVTTIGDMTFDGGTVSASGTFTVGGDFETNGVDLTNDTYVVTGTATAHDATITGTNFAGGSSLDASDNDIDGGGNVGVRWIPLHSLTITAARHVPTIVARLMP